MTMPRQLALALPHAENFAREDFLSGPPNEAALNLIERWPDWPDRALAIVGPEGAGSVSARVIGETNLPGALATGALVIEDANSDLDERALFHLLNLMRQQDAFVLMTARAPPATWRIELADLASRLRAIPVVQLRPPDDALLRAVMVKLFADRQLAVDEALIAYLSTRIERSFAAARAAVEDLDREALRQKRPVTRALAAELLGQA
jgi:chromosomal replication initiation ATPase DnaA